MGEWKTYRLGEICKNIIDYRGKTPAKLGADWAKSGYRVFSAKNIKTGNIVQTDSIRYVDENLYRKWMKDEIERGDIIITSEAPFGEVYYWDSDEKIVLGQRLFGLKINEICYPKYLYYYMTTAQFQSGLKNRATGTTVIGLRQPELLKCTVNLPPLEEQRRIAGILGSLDDKIELNRRINANLEAQAQALFRSWFVDFEPFRDGPFVDSELGKIPQGWKVAELGDVTKQQTEKVGPQKTVKVLSPITTGELVLSEEYFTKQVFSESIAKYIIVKPDQFAYNPARINIGSIGRNTFEFDGCVSPVYVVFECEKGYHYFFDFFRKTDAFKQEVISRAIGGVRQTLGYKDFALIKVIYPPQNVVLEFNRIYTNLLNLQNHNILEIKTLSALRDTLLPKLMAGEINVE